MSTARAAADGLLAQNRALGDPTRHRVFAYVRDAPDRVGVAELTEHFRLHHNAIRQHLAKLVAAGLLIEETAAPSGRGRPRLVYRPTPGASERWGGTGPHQALALMLLELLDGGGTPRDVGRRAGQRMAADYGPGVDTTAVLETVARRLGFEPRVEPARGGSAVVLDRCPFVDAAGTSPGIVCDLHHGIAEGIADHVADGATVRGLVTRPAPRAGCRIEVAVPA